MKSPVRVSADHLREAATIGAVAVTLWAVMPRLMTTLFITLHPLAAFVFTPDSAAFRYLFYIMMLAGFFGSLILVAAIYRKLIYLLTGTRRSSLNKEMT